MRLKSSICLKQTIIIVKYVFANLMTTAEEKLLADIERING